MRKIYFIFFYFYASSASAQNGFPIKIQDFSDIYEAVIELNAEDEIVKQNTTSF